MKRWKTGRAVKGYEGRFDVGFVSAPLQYFRTAGKRRLTLLTLGHDALVETVASGKIVAVKAVSA